MEAGLLRIAQSAMANAAQHDHANGVDVTLTRLDDEIILDVVDDGDGFDPSQLTTGGDRPSFGLVAMRDGHDPRRHTGGGVRPRAWGQRRCQLRADHMSVRVLIVDDHPLMRTGLTALFETDPTIEVVAAVGTTKQALVEEGRMNPDVVLTDLQFMRVFEGAQAKPPETSARCQIHQRCWS